MGKSILFGGLMLMLVCGFSFPSQDIDLSKSLVKYRTEWGKPCNQCTEATGTHRAYFRNDSKLVLDVRVAAQEKTMRWRIFNRLAMQPGDSIVAYACKGTGKYMNWVKIAGDNEAQFPTEDEINRNYGK